MTKQLTLLCRDDRLTVTAPAGAVITGATVATGTAVSGEVQPQPRQETHGILLSKESRSRVRKSQPCQPALFGAYP
jgi:hypothetical protein